MPQHRKPKLLTKSNRRKFAEQWSVSQNDIGHCLAFNSAYGLHDMLPLEEIWQEYITDLSIRHVDLAEKYDVSSSVISSWLHKIAEELLAMETPHN